MIASTERYPMQGSCVTFGPILNNSCSPFLGKPMHSERIFQSIHRGLLSGHFKV